MIRIEKADRWRHCNCCHSQKDVHEFYFAAQNHGINVALCDSCIVELLEKIREERKDND
jgi:hypothetical protein